MVRKLRLNESNDYGYEDIMSQVFDYLKRIGIRASFSPFPSYAIMRFSRNGEEIEFNLECKKSEKYGHLIWLDFVDYVRYCSEDEYDYLLNIFTETELTDFCDFLKKEVYFTEV